MWLTQQIIQWLLRVLSLVVKQQEYAVNRSLPTSAKIKKVWSSTFTRPLCPHGMYGTNLLCSTLWNISVKKRQLFRNVCIFIKYLHSWLCPIVALLFAVRVASDLCRDRCLSALCGDAHCVPDTHYICTLLWVYMFQYPELYDKVCNIVGMGVNWSLSPVVKWP